MANKKDNPLIGSFRAPVPDTPPPAGAIGEQKPAEPPKTAPDPKATGATPVKGGEGQKLPYSMSNSGHFQIFHLFQFSSPYITS